MAKVSLQFNVQYKKWYQNTLWHYKHSAYSELVSGVTPGDHRWQS